MRTIDADALKIAIRQELDVAKQIAGDEADIFISKMIEEAFFDIIDNAPTIEPDMQPTCNQLATDCISRQEAINETWREPRYTDPLNVLTEIRERIRSLPPAQPETGKWIKLYAGNYKCSVCGVWFANDDNEMVEDFKYCPNCGCKMEVEVEE